MDKRDAPPTVPRKDGDTIPEAGPDAEPRFDAPSSPAPEVVDAPGRNTEF